MTEATDLNNQTAEQRNESAANDGSQQVLNAASADPRAKADIFEAVQELEQLRIESQQIAAKRREIRERLDAKYSLIRMVLDFAIKVYRASEEQREGLDHSYRTVREALGLPVQVGLFEGADDGAVKH